MVLDFLAVDNFEFTRKIVKKIEFLDKNLTFRVVCNKNTTATTLAVNNGVQEVRLAWVMVGLGHI